MNVPCLVIAKADAQLIAVDPALKHPNVELLTGAYVRRLEISPAGRVVETVVFEKDGDAVEVSADIVVSSCGAINSAALLLRSANETHPNGLANRSGVVGRHYMAHNNSAMLALSRTPNPTVFQKTLAVNDYYFGSDDWEYPLGHIQMLGKSDAVMLEAEAPKLAPGMALEFMAKHAMDFWLTTEDLPDPDNRVVLDGDGAIRLHYKENNLKSHHRLVAKLKGMLGEIGCDDKLLPCHLYLGKKIPIAGVAHQCGTVRFGRNPETTALDVNCKAHDLDNLYVVDGSFFVSSTSSNPAFTIMANALRVAEHLLERLR